MIKHFILITVLSIAVVLFMTQAEQSLQVLLAAYTYIAVLLKDVFSGGQMGNLLRELLALLCLPFLACFILSVIYWFIRRNWFPYFMEVVWFIWLLQAGALIALHKIV